MNMQSDPDSPMLGSGHSGNDDAGSNTGQHPVKRTRRQIRHRVRTHHHHHPLPFASTLVHGRRENETWRIGLLTCRHLGAPPPQQETEKLRRERLADGYSRLQDLLVLPRTLEKSAVLESAAARIVELTKALERVEKSNAVLTEQLAQSQQQQQHHQLQLLQLQQQQQQVTHTFSHGSSSIYPTQPQHQHGHLTMHAPQQTLVGSPNSDHSSSSSPTQSGLIAAPGSFPSHPHDPVHHKTSNWPAQDHRHHSDRGDAWQGLTMRTSASYTWDMDQKPGVEGNLHFAPLASSHTMRTHQNRPAYAGASSTFNRDLLDLAIDYPHQGNNPGTTDADVEVLSTRNAMDVYDIMIELKVNPCIGRFKCQGPRVLELNTHAENMLGITACSIANTLNWHNRVTVPDDPMLNVRDLIQFLSDKSLLLRSVRRMRTSTGEVIWSYGVTRIVELFDIMYPVLESNFIPIEPPADGRALVVVEPRNP
ncbi:uncharacterized protein MONBRDRAFT_37483 [Monosiga brevicollis MX1]|uniref:BHLH domain-containing protein n=1 Tax=Monosiga brevicollis TaxID=81824 RepID=A9V211_MONBE|nr:uncharacterized protein MONBRDRAFT_37483 [Monosiga brevicollis MX1]EDQ88661.1 predicted protein [Monosiga brevicollis MX1]|eukprot:XP_001746765.1 hypothetical protein [Monosiga brevicollis MX1]